ncbi:MAG: amidohydrolase family protein [Bacteroidota bacterium]
MKSVFIFLILIFYADDLKSQLNIDSLNIVDYHVHIFSEGLIHNLEAQGYNMANSGFQIINESASDYSNLDKILKDNSSFKMVLISTSYAYKQLDTINWMNEKEFLQLENDLLAKLIQKQPKKLLGFYGINPLKGYALNEIKRCHEELKLHGLKLHFQGNHVDLNNEDHLQKVKAILSYASKEKIPVLIHNNAWNIEDGQNYANTFIAQVLEEIDSLTIIFAHAGGGGGFFKFTKDFLSTFDEYFKTADASRNHNIYFELSGVIKLRQFSGSQDLKELEVLMENIGFDRFIFGSDYPVKNASVYIKTIMNKLNLRPNILKAIIERDIFQKSKRN